MNEYFIKRPLREWWLTALLISLNIALFAFQFIKGVHPMQPAVQDLITWGADFAPLTLGTENWRLLSSMFLHIGIMHLLINMWALYLFGVYAEFYYGRLWYVIIYFAAGIVGNLTTNALDLYQASVSIQQDNVIPTVSAGASGAIMGIGAALLIAALWPKLDLPHQYHLNKNALITLMLLNFGIGIIVSGINNAAHFGGFMAGLLLSMDYRISLFFANQIKISAQVIMLSLSIILIGLADYWLLQQAHIVNSLWSVYIR